MKINYTLFVLLCVFVECGCKSSTQDKNKITKQDSTNTQTITNGNGFTSKGLYNDLLKLVQNKSTNLSQEYYDTAVDALSRNQNSKAIEYLNSAIKADPNYTGAYCVRAITRILLNDTAGVLSDFNMALKLNPELILGYYYRSFYKWNYMHDSIGALKDETIAVNLDTTNIRTLEQRFIMRRELHDYKGAIEDLNEIIRLKPNSAVYFRYRGIVKAYMHDFEGSIIDYSNAIVLDNDTASYFNRAISEVYIGSYDKAILDFSKTIEYNPNMGMAYLYRGRLQIKTGNKDKGCEDLYKAKKIGIQEAAIDIRKYNCNKE